MNRKNLQTAIAIFFIATTALQAKTIYVKSGGGNDNNAGDSWNTAYASLQKALSNAVAGDEIWVANGTYLPTANRGYDTANRDMAFILKPDVKLYGGFAGTETSFAERQLPPFGTESGTKLCGQDVINFIYSYHVVISAGNVGTACLDGFTIYNGWANGTGSITVNGRSIRQNCGGGIYISASSPAITNVTIRDNYAGAGAGMYCSFSSRPTLTNVSISKNIANTDGGGISIDEASAILSNVTISKNEGYNGGGIFLYDSYASLTDVTISGNTAAQHGGGMANRYSSNPTLTNVIISGNTATKNGGGVYNEGSSFSMTMTNITITGNTAENGGGMYNNVAAFTLTNSIISGNKATAAGSSTTGCGGGIYLANGYSIGTPMIITNVLISGNTAYDGGGIYNYQSPMTLSNVTIAGNYASHYAGGICIDTDGDIISDIRNTIIWGNNDINNDRPGVGSYDTGNETVFNNCLVQQELNTLKGVQTGNIGLSTVGSAPVFVNPVAAGLSTAGDYSLVANSPVIDKGNNSYNTTATDLAGNPRKNGTIDMGAYEFYITHTVTFNSSGGSAIPVQKVTVGGKVIKPADPTRGSDIFAGWFTENTYSSAWDFSNHVVTGDITLYAKWTPGTSILDAQTSTVNIYPNPAQNTLYIESAETVEHVSIYDISGRVLLQEINPNQSIDINSLAIGIYLVKVKTAQGETVKKIVKQ